MRDPHQLCVPSGHLGPIADPISRSRDKDATPAEKELGAARAT